MCAIFGMSLHHGTFDEEDFVYLKNLILQSKIRGLHATGLAWISNGKVQIDRRPIPGDEFVNQFDFNQLKGTNLVIGHCRYSTSDLSYNQPIGNEEAATVHNGVISQAELEDWPKLGDYETRNDSEILHKILLMKEPDWNVLGKGSAAFLHLKADGSFMAMRNGSRPMWLGKFVEITVFASTQDILKRTFTDGVFTEEASLGTIYGRQGQILSQANINQTEEQRRP